MVITQPGPNARFGFPRSIGNVTGGPPSRPRGRLAVLALTLGADTKRPFFLIARFENVKHEDNFLVHTRLSLLKTVIRPWDIANRSSTGQRGARAAIGSDRKFREVCKATQRSVGNTRSSAELVRRHEAIRCYREIRLSILVFKASPGIERLDDCIGSGGFLWRRWEGFRFDSGR